jgi:hypothetical protein
VLQGCLWSPILFFSSFCLESCWLSTFTLAEGQQNIVILQPSLIVEAKTFRKQDISTVSKRHSQDHLLITRRNGAYCRHLKNSSLTKWSDLLSPITTAHAFGLMPQRHNNNYMILLPRIFLCWESNLET